MSDLNQGTLVHEMLGRFIEEAVGKAVREQVDVLTHAAQKSVEAAVEQILEQSKAKMAAEVELTRQRIREESQKAMDDLPLTAQGSLMQMMQESETMFQRRTAEWSEQFCGEQAAELSEGAKAHMAELCKKTLGEMAESAQAVRERSLVDFRAEFQNHFNGCLQSAAERLTAA